MNELIHCCASVIANARYLRMEAITRGDREQMIAMDGRVDAIVMLAAMVGLSVQTIYDLVAIESERIRLAVKKAA